MASSGQSSQRRPMGALEGQVLAFLWRADRSVTPAEVLDGTGLDLAYTTVMTILVRLWKKGLVEREPHGRAYAYRPRIDEAEYVARSMQEVLGQASDRTAVLNRFVGGLSRKDTRALRSLLDTAPPS
jgi:predicted transcriptional regulator